MRIGLITVLAAMVAGSAMAQGLQPSVRSTDTTVTWDAPTTYTDGTPLAAAPGAKLYWGAATRNYSKVADVGLAPTATMTNLTWDTMYYCAVTAYEIADPTNESVFSGELAFVTPKPPPMPPTGAHTVKIVVTVDVYVDGTLVP